MKMPYYMELSRNTSEVILRYDDHHAIVKGIHLNSIKISKSTAHFWSTHQVIYMQGALHLPHDEELKKLVELFDNIKRADFGKMSLAYLQNNTMQHNISDIVMLNVPDRYVDFKSQGFSYIDFKLSALTYSSVRIDDVAVQRQKKHNVFVKAMLKANLNVERFLGWEGGSRFVIESDTVKLLRCYTAADVEELKQVYGESPLSIRFIPSRLDL